MQPGPVPIPSLLLPACHSTTEDASTRTTICSYAKIATLAQQDLSSLDDMWDPQDACSQAILPGGCTVAGHRAGGEGRQRPPASAWCSWQLHLRCYAMC